MTAATIAAWACLAMAGPPGVAQAATAPDGTSHGGAIGIRLMEAPVAERNNPRAYRYIIDHVRPGATVERRVEIANESAQPHRVDLSAGAATVRHGTFIFDGGGQTNELTSWTTVGERSVRLGPGQRRAVTVTIRVPTTATGGEHFGVIWAAVTARPKHGGITAVNRVGVRVYLDVGPGGAPPSDFAIGTLTATRSTDGVPSLSVAVRNTGGRAVDVGGTVELTEGPAGLRAGPATTDATTTLRPGESGTVVFTLPRTVPNGPWRAEISLVSGTSRHTARATVTFPDPAGAPRTTHPLATWRTALVAGGVVALVVVVTSIIVYRRRRSKPETSSSRAASPV
jgi:hypothetical protein